MNDATLDFDRFARRGYAEAIYCDGKSVGQVTEIAELWRARAQEQELGALLFTRTSAEQRQAILTVFPDAVADDTSRVMAWPPTPPEPRGNVTVVCAGTADVPVAREAAITARYLGREVAEITDVGVAGLDRILSRIAELRAADVIVVVAGLDEIGRAHV